MHPTVCVQVLAVTVVIYCGRCLSFIMRERANGPAKKTCCVVNIMHRLKNVEKRPSIALGLSPSYSLSFFVTFSVFFCMLVC